MGDMLTSGTEYEATRTIWNGAVTTRPLAVLRCATPADVQAGVRTAREKGLPLSVRGGGHDWAGRALTDGGLTLDLSPMRQVSVDPATAVATVAGGATSADLAAAAQRAGLVAVTGTAGSVGMAGLTLGGGYGPLSGRFGLAADNLLSADVVLADGTSVTADEERDPELLWALRGGGGNFGVVTSMRIRLHTVPTILAGMIMFGSDVLPELEESLLRGPDELTVQAGFITAPTGGSALFVAPTWCGEPEAGTKVLQRLTELGEPLTAQFGPTTMTDQLAQIDAMFPAGRHVEIGARTVTGLDRTVQEILLDAAGATTSPLSAISLHSLHGAAARVPADATAFRNRTPHLMVETIAVWEPGDPAEGRHRAWVRKTDRLPGGYPNLLGPGDAARTAAAFGPNAERLLSAKKRYDPDLVFHAPGRL
ncbi:FAD-binding oxidoreductase [Micromonospora sp. WMMA1998]|uniref:FAD-binding oxidoreductase n=1 Tax=Micromonospora sp. WMMA1998 TaxID=3015167 RepID=UPI00248CE933|nr:FAD-binding oxidoreductase [Micromonospora sp. WMMA1998]WBC16689.1 FAD-binding oxidoreductase [Micromonospora sp. WMMA1998]